MPWLDAVDIYLLRVVSGELHDSISCYVVMVLMTYISRSVRVTDYAYNASSFTGDNGKPSVPKTFGVISDSNGIPA